MKKEYDFSKAKKNPYIHQLKKQLTIRLDTETIEYFQRLSQENGIPYQTLMNLYLRDCARKHKRLNMQWSPEK
ncbi:MAG: BrnA antitoxin family protein [Proteobacteria bacterium]|nr:BrnA antitoxin family protein [Pseudomonadota bacterium]